MLALMGLPMPGEMDSKVLFEVGTRAGGQGEAEENPYSEKDEARVMERLRELYVV